MNVGLLLTMASTATTRYASVQCVTPTHLAPNDILPPTVLDGATSRQRIKVVAVEHASRGARLPPPGAQGEPSPWRAFTWRRTWNARARGQPLGAHSGGAAEAASETALTHLVVLSSVASAAEEASWKAFALQEELDPGGWCNQG